MPPRRLSQQNTTYGGQLTDRPYIVGRVAHRANQAPSQLAGRKGRWCACTPRCNERRWQTYPRCTQCRTGTWSVLPITPTPVPSVLCERSTECPVPGQCQPKPGTPVPSAWPVSAEGWHSSAQCRPCGPTWSASHKCLNHQRSKDEMWSLKVEWQSIWRVRSSLDLV